MIHAMRVLAAAENTNPLVPAPADILWSTVCFLVILFFFWKVGIPRLTKLLDERSAAIEGNVAKADEAQVKAEALLEEYTAQLAEARAEAARIREQAREEGKRILAELKEQANAEAERVTTAAQAQIDAERHAALVSLRSEVGSLALDLASGIITQKLQDDETASVVVERFLAELEDEQPVGTPAGSAD
ncbi:MAG TPA: F0F1 ATP synthase subunit B [Microbacteriaceae bacterium]|nr:F0F1 ATP synthase subunit B [Microbacteriaceae bacterium]